MNIYFLICLLCCIILSLDSYLKGYDRGYYDTIERMNKQDNERMIADSKKLKAIYADALIQKAQEEAEGMEEPFKSNLGALIEWLVEKTPEIQPDDELKYTTY